MYIYIYIYICMYIKNKILCRYKYIYSGYQLSFRLGPARPAMLGICDQEHGEIEPPCGQRLGQDASLPPECVPTILSTRVFSRAILCWYTTTPGPFYVGILPPANLKSWSYITLHTGHISTSTLVIYHQVHWSHITQYTGHISPSVLVIFHQVY